jgi:hypothetical protein
MTGGLIATAKGATWRLGRGRSRSITRRGRDGSGEVKLRPGLTEPLVVVVGWLAVEVVDVARVASRVIAMILLRLLAIIGLLRTGRVAHGRSAAD